MVFQDAIAGTIIEVQLKSHIESCHSSLLQNTIEEEEELHFQSKKQERVEVNLAVRMPVTAAANAS